MQTYPYFHFAAGDAPNRHMFGPVCALGELACALHKQDELRRRMVSHNTPISVISKRKKNQWYHPSNVTKGTNLRHSLMTESTAGIHTTIEVGK